MASKKGRLRIEVALANGSQNIRLDHGVQSVPMLRSHANDNDRYGLPVAIMQSEALVHPQRGVMLDKAKLDALVYEHIHRHFPKLKDALACLVENRDSETVMKARKALKEASWMELR